MNTLAEFASQVKRVDRLYCRYDGDSVLHDVDDVMVTDTDIHVTFTGVVTRVLTAPLSATHRLYRNRLELCDKTGIILLILEATSVDFYKLTLMQEDITP